MSEDEKDNCIEAYKFASNHKKQLEKDKVCGCFYCGRIFDPCEINVWIKDKEGTAMCPYCHIDAIIGESSGFLITKELLKQMKEKYF